MDRYAQLTTADTSGLRTVVQVIESATDPDGINGEWVLCGNVGPGWTTADDGQNYAPPAQPVVVDSCEWLIDIGPFFDRFGAAKMAVLTSADVSVKAILSDIQVRKWVDLKRPDVAQALTYVGSKVPAVTPALQAAILQTPVTFDENRALRKQFF